MSAERDQSVSDADVQDALRRARQVDPASTRQAVAHYLGEIAEMARLLDRVDLENAPHAATFSPAWTARGEQ